MNLFCTGIYVHFSIKIIFGYALPNHDRNYPWKEWIECYEILYNIINA